MNTKLRHEANNLVGYHCYRTSEQTTVETSSSPSKVMSNNSNAIPNSIIWYIAAWISFGFVISLANEYNLQYKEYYSDSSFHSPSDLLDSASADFDGIFHIHYARVNSGDSLILNVEEISHYGG